MESGLALVSRTIQAKPRPTSRRSRARRSSSGTKIAATAYELLLDGIRTAQEAGEIRAHDTRELALGAWSMVHGLAALAVDRQLANKGFSATKAVDLADQLTDQIYRGLHP